MRLALANRKGHFPPVVGHEANRDPIDQARRRQPSDRHFHPRRPFPTRRIVEPNARQRPGLAAPAGDSAGTVAGDWAIKAAPSPPSTPPQRLPRQAIPTRCVLRMISLAIVPSSPPPTPGPPECPGRGTRLLDRHRTQRHAQHVQVPRIAPQPDRPHRRPPARRPNRRSCGRSPAARPASGRRRSGSHTPRPRRLGGTPSSPGDQP